MVCPKCGAEIPEGKAFCPGCGQALISAEAPSEPDSTTAEIARRATSTTVKYAGFWLRFLAFVIDWVALSFVLGPLLVRLFPNLDQIRPPLTLPSDPAAAEAVVQEFWTHFPTIMTANTIVFVAMGVYFSLMEGSPWQATLGKRLLGLQVTDLQGRRISFARATARHFAKLGSIFSLFIGFAIAGITKRKQALHDIITECLVIRKTPRS